MGESIGPNQSKLLDKSLNQGNGSISKKTLSQNFHESVVGSINTGIIGGKKQTDTSLNKVSLNLNN